MVYFHSTQELDGIEFISIEDVNKFIVEANWLGIDTETTGLVPLYHKPLLLILGNEINQIVIDLRTTDKAVILELATLLDGRLLLGHNIKFDYKMLMHHYPSIELPIIWDTMVINRVLYNGYKKVRHGLDYCLDKHLGISMDKAVRKSFIGKEDNSKFTVAEVLYAAKDVQYLKALYEAQLKSMYSVGMDYMKLFEEVEMPLIPVLAKMEITGFNFDKDLWLSLADKSEDFLFDLKLELDKEVNRLSKDYRQLISSGLTKIRYNGCNDAAYNNYNSRPLLLSIFRATGAIADLEQAKGLEEKRVKKLDSIKSKREAKNTIKFTNGSVAKQGSLFDLMDTYELPEDSKYELGVAALEKYIKNDLDNSRVLNHFVRLLLQYRKTAKSVSTYGTTFIDNLSEDGRIRTEYSQVFTATGRLSSSKYVVQGKKKEGYNAQNIPHIKELRHCFIADEGYEIVTIDYGGQENALAASQSKDPLLIGAITDGLDIHSIMAEASYRIIRNDPTLKVSKNENKDLRNAHKPVLFGLYYGATAARIAVVLNVVRTVAEDVYNNIKANLLPTFFKHQSNIQRKAVKDRYVDDHTKYKRRRWFTPTDQTHRIEKQASNYPMQSSGASMVKESMVKVSAYLKQFEAQFPKVGILKQVHDEIVFQIPKGHRYMADKAKEIMIEVGNTYLDGVTIEVSVDIEPYWTK